MILNIIAGAAGILLVGIALRDIFEAVIVPRATAPSLRVSRYVLRSLWRWWPRLAYRRYSDGDKREDFLAGFAPFFLVLMLATWVLMLVIGWGLFFFAIRDQLRPPHLGLGASIYYAGGALLSSNGPEILPVTGFARAMTLVIAASGLGVVAIVISFLFAVFGSFQRRETFVVSISARAGTPPSGTGILVVHGMVGIRSDLAHVFREAQSWTAEVMENHLAYPILILFRSSHDYQSWVGTLGALLDAAVLVLTTIDPQSQDDPAPGQARILYDLGRHLTHDFSNYFGFMHSNDSDGVGVDRSEFDSACTRLLEAGYRISDRERAWQNFCRFRSAYAAPLNRMARWLEIPPLQWIGDRSMLRTPHGSEVAPADAAV